MEILKGWNKITRAEYTTLKTFFSDVETPEFYFSLVECIAASMFFKIIDGGLYIVKPSQIMGNQSLILYSTPRKNRNAESELLKAGISLRGAELTGAQVTKDPYGIEYLYNTNDFDTLEGAKFARARNILNRYKTVFKIGMNDDVVKICNNWTQYKNEKHQKKLLKTVAECADFLHITTTYHNNLPVGFSVIEKVNEKTGIILMRLTNPDIYGDIKEPTFLLHENDCTRFPNMLLNYGGAVGIKSMELAKKKLNPAQILEIKRVKASVKLTKENFNYFKDGCKNE